MRIDMRKLFLFIITVCLSFLLSACQVYQNFVVINSSENEIEIEYTLRKTGLPPEESLFLPQRTSLENWNSRFGKKDWEEMSNDRFRYEAIERKFFVKLNPKEVVLIEQEDSFDMDKQKEKSFDLIDLRIKDNGKELYFENGRRLFEEFEKNDFQIIYK
jgi:hypothetical protein